MFSEAVYEYLDMEDVNYMINLILKCVSFPINNAIIPDITNELLNLSR